MKSLKEKWSSIVQSTSKKGENGVGGSSTVTRTKCLVLYVSSHYTRVCAARDLIMQTA